LHRSKHNFEARKLETYTLEGMASQIRCGHFMGLQTKFSIVRCPYMEV